MPCYCKDISNIDQDLKTLKSMSSLLNTMSDKDSTLTSMFAQLSNDVAGSVSPSNISSLADKVSKLNKKTKDTRSSMALRIKNEISALENKKKSLTSSDRNYHESMLAGS
ncbi:MAG: hypothetical protein FWH52_01450 [Synergistaceae bacterium]|nr:hypothetical protein [Synergistaceae bacterium]